MLEITESSKIVAITTKIESTELLAVITRTKVTQIPCSAITI